MRSTFVTGSLLASMLLVLFLPGLALQPVVQATARLPLDRESAEPRAKVGAELRVPATWRESEWLGAALPSLRTGQWEDARRVIEASAVPADRDEQARADFLRGLLLLRTGRADLAVDLLAAAARWAGDSGSPLGTRAWFHLGEAREALGDEAQAAAAFERVASPEGANAAPEGVLAPWAALRRGQALAALGQSEAALAALRPLALARPARDQRLPPTGGGRAADAADLRERAELRLTALSAALPLAEQHEAALVAPMRRALLVEYPCSQAARDLAARPDLASPQARLALLGPEAMAERCEALVGDACEREALADLPALLESQPDAALGDRARLLLGRALRGDGQQKKALAELRAVSAHDPQAFSRAQWESAAACKALGQRSEQRRHLRACAEGPASTWRDKAALSLAQDEAEAGRLASARDLWRRVAADSPDPAARVQAAWRAAWSQHRAGLENAALASYESLAEAAPSRREAAAARYWAARILARRGQADEARARLVSLASDFARDYYGIVAADEAGLPPPSGDACVGASLHQALADSLARLGGADAVTGRVAAELLRLGLVDDALEELRHARVGEDGVAALARDESRTLALAIAGRRAAALRVFRESVPDWRSRADLSPAVWCAVYPLAYDDIVLTNCAERGLDPALVCGLIHQESVFEPAAVSWVGARGLMQVMPATGRTIARWLDERVTTSQLVEPETNVRYGTEYIARLLDEFGHPEPALAGYNAGPGRARRWWKQAGSGRDVPLFVESIPIDETREYVKAITWSSRMYRSAWSGAFEARAAQRAAAAPAAAPATAPAVRARR